MFQVELWEEILPNFCKTRFFFPQKKILKKKLGTSLVVQWLRLHAPNAGVQLPSLVREQRSHMLQLRVYAPRLRPGAAKQINKKGFFEKKKTWRHPHLLFFLPPPSLTSFPSHLISHC